MMGTACDVQLYVLALILALTATASCLPASDATYGTGPAIRHFDLTLTWEAGSPDGVERDMFKINGQFPGPLLEMTEGDDVVVVVQNKSPYNTTIHYHGIEQLYTPWSDGVPGVTQNQIQPGCGFTYRWKATQHGSYWYHSHSDSHINDGLYGPIVIHPASSSQKPWHLITTDPASIEAIEKAERARIPLVLSDWRHVISEKEWEISQQSHIDHLCFDSILVNGQGNVNCLTAEEMARLTTPTQAGLLNLVPGSQLTDKACLPPTVLAVNDPPAGPAPNLSAIPPGIFNGCQATSTPPHTIRIVRPSCDRDRNETWAVFDLIAAFSLATVHVSLDEVPVWVFAADGHYTAPVSAHAVPLVNGQRYSVLARLTDPKRYTLRVAATSDPQILFGTAVVDFSVEEGAVAQSAEPSVPFIDRRGRPVSGDVVVFDPDGVVPFADAQALAAAAVVVVDATFKFALRVGESLNVWALDQTPRPEALDDEPPLLLLPGGGGGGGGGGRGQPAAVADRSITVPAGADWVDYVMVVPRGQPPHPVHVHGRHFHVLGRGVGDFPWATVGEAMAGAGAALPPGALNLLSPPARDTFSTLASTAGAPSWLVVRRRSDNAGAWLMHCHIQSHVRGGMSLVIRDGLGAMSPSVPPEYSASRCAA